MVKNRDSRNFNIFGVVAILAALVAVLVGVYMRERQPIQQISFGHFMESLSRGEIAEVTLSDQAHIRFRFEAEGLQYMTNNPRRDTFKEELLLSNVAVLEGAGSINWQLIIILSIVVAAIVFTRRKSNALAPATVAINPAEAIKKYSFADMAGNEEAKESVADVVDFLANPEKYSKYGARMPRGLILHGMPGTGKTLMAKAMAGEAEVPFYAVSGSDFVQMYVGVGAARVRELFKKARASGKAVIFIDEIDALGKKRSNGTSGGNDERDQTLNALLTEMSGFTENEGIVVVAATNRLDTLDDALLRPGRFDRQVEVAMPDINARRQILKLHGENKPIIANLEKWARDTVFFSGAMLEGLINEAAILAAKEGAGHITDNDMERAYYITLAGYEKKDRTTLRQQERRLTAYHEAGHALAAKLVTPENTVAKVTIIPSSKGVGGFCVNIPPEKMYYTKQELEQQIIVHIAGRCAEELVFGSENITTGASNDIEKATRVAKRYIGQYGMCKEVGLLDMRSMGRNANLIQSCKRMMDQLYNDTLQLLSDNQDKLEAIALALLEKETLDEAALDLLIA
ncbi:MAG: AAA family ATPase [Defluviitaleaceae bacterium]|nr:AAA family ATPase [Defluviitaleaceae bacterium]